MRYVHLYSNILLANIICITKLSFESILQWHARLDTANSNIIWIVGPATSYWDRKISTYHMKLNSTNPCHDTQREHEKAYQAAKTKSIHYKLELPPSCKIDNFLYSNDYVKMDARRLILSEVIETTVLSTGSITWVGAFATKQDSTSCEKDDKVDVDKLLGDLTI